MTKVKIIKETVCTWNSTAETSILERDINKFLKENPEITILDIKMQNVDVNYHNNARYNTIEIWCMIIYEEV